MNHTAARPALHGPRPPDTAPAAPPAPSRRAWLAGALGIGTAVASSSSLSGCAHRSAEEASAADQRPAATRVLPFSTAALGTTPPGWRPYSVRRDLSPTRYAVVRDGNRRVLHASARASATGLHCAVDIDPAQFGQLQFSWRVKDVPGRADVAAAEHDDCPARLIVAFGGDDTRLPLRDRLFYEQVELFTGQRLPYATLMYVWDGGTHEPESVHRNHRSARIQYLTVESGAQRAGRWLHYERDLQADYQRVFGEAPGAIVGIGVLTDADALKLELEAWYGDITLTPGTARPARQLSLARAAAGTG